MLSIVIPTLNEAAALPMLLGDLARLRVAHETVVVDGGSEDGTCAVARERGARVVASPRGRGQQLGVGVGAARGDVLCTLHADVRLSVGALAALERFGGTCDDDRAYAFSLRIAASGWRYRVVERGANLRSRRAHLPYGDQGLVLTRACYERAGGYAPVEIFEDVDFVRRLRRVAHVVTRPECIVVSSRRWERDGVFRRTTRNTVLLARYFLGASPERLALSYMPEGPPEERA
jgi:rSAM/selenodomain-associated transferase 2